MSVAEIAFTGTNKQILRRPHEDNIGGTQKVTLRQSGHGLEKHAKTHTVKSECKIKPKPMGNSLLVRTAQSSSELRAHDRSR